MLSQNIQFNVKIIETENQFNDKIHYDERQTNEYIDNLINSLQSLGSSLPSSQSNVPSQNFSLSRQEKVGLHGIVSFGHVMSRPSARGAGLTSHKKTDFRNMLKREFATD